MSYSRWHEPASDDGPETLQLNPVENLWHFLRKNFLANRVFDSYEAIVDVCCNAWSTLLAMPERVASITSRDWRRSMDNAVGIILPFHGSTYSKTDVRWSSPWNKSMITSKIDRVYKNGVILKQAGIITGLIGVVCVLWPSYEIAQEGVTTARILSVFLSIFSFLPFTVTLLDRVETFGLNSVLSRWSVFLVCAAAIALGLFGILMLIGHLAAAIIIFLIALCISYYMWPTFPE